MADIPTIVMLAGSIDCTQTFYLFSHIKQTRFSFDYMLSFVCLYIEVVIPPGIYCIQSSCYNHVHLCLDF